MENSEIKFIESFGKLEIKEGDTIVLKTPLKLSQDVANAIYLRFQEYRDRLGFKKLEIIILHSGMDIGVIDKI